ncbi:YihY/virulence factor BrkB family protein [Noviherbaspirillum malthae]|jgi:membrane protein|uniref:YihY/virulence factor BrkB family protein n=1 Tax=Noviherbaspirillum malthae TaxID=1260987 RepID=UPI00189030B9|nr:YihY/virulence factor BrkB family protein [Noviherbaspirillum malthae]
MNIPGLRGLSIGKLFVTSFKEFIGDDMPTQAAALAYHILFSLFPFFIFLIALISTLHLPDFIDWLRQQAEFLLPGQAMDQVNVVLNELREPQGGLLSVGAVVALWTASAAARATMNAFNAAYGIRENRPIWLLYPLSILYTMAIAALLILSAALLLIGPQAMQWLSDQIGFEQFFVTLWTWLRWPVILLLLSLSAALVYYSAPAAQPRFPFITPGAVLAVLIWILASLGFDYYVRNFADYSATYGSVGSVIVLLLYFYISAAVLLFGAEINACIERHAPTGNITGNKQDLRDAAVARKQPK